VVLVCLLISALPAYAWNADFFEKSASGAATYEEMVIHPQAVYDPDTEHTYIVYQGSNMHPHIMAYDHNRSRWKGPYIVGTNALVLNTHGAPAVVIDSEGRLVVFYGGHLGAILQARTKRAGDIARWDDLGAVRVGTPATTILATYPQPVVEEDGSIRLYYRRDGMDAPTRGDWESVVSTTTAGGGLAWSQPEMVIDAQPPTPGSADSTPTGSYWYVNVDHSVERGPAIAAVRRDYTTLPQTDFHIRRGIYYLERPANEATWTAVGGAHVDAARDFASLELTAAVVPEAPETPDGPEVFTNQVVMRRDAAGNPGILYLAGSHLDQTYEWRFSHWTGAEWTHEVITTTDSFFDSGTFEYLQDGTIEAFLTTGGAPDDQWLDDPATPTVDESRYAVRGGDITQWRLTDGGAGWQKVRTVIASPGPHARYNNPQIVRGYRDGARLIFSEWNNDSSSFIHKVYLWGNDGSFVQRNFTPEFHRLAGATRIETAVEISKQGFPSKAGTAVIAASHDYPDVLCGVPLAQALRAPVLLSSAGALDPAVTAELARLDVGAVVILGGDRAVSAGVESALRNLTNSRGAKLKVSRIAGADRYDTSAKIAQRVVELRGAPARVILASGESFADALAASPYAARRGYPILLTPGVTTRSSIIAFLKDLRPDELMVVGGEAAVSTSVVDEYEKSIGILGDQERWAAGANRYETGRIIADHALDEGHSLERFSVTTGESFADAVGGGLLAARYNSVLLTTPSALLHPEIEDLLSRRAFGSGVGVLDVYVLGGPSAVSPEVENALAARVTLLDALSP
jgi:putative cell wall-binding protein